MVLDKRIQDAVQQALTVAGKPPLTQLERSQQVEYDQQKREG